MKTHMLKLGLVLTIMMSVASFRGPKWELLGARMIDFKLDHDEIVVTGKEGRFDAIRLRVNKGTAHIHKVVVHYRNGGRQEIEFRQRFTPGSESRVADLTGDDRVIRKIDLWYDTRNNAGQKAVVQVWGRH